MTILDLPYPSTGTADSKNSASGMRSCRNGKLPLPSKTLERKEREVREVSDRYKTYIMELESQLDQDADAKHELQLEINKLKSNLSTVSQGCFARTGGNCQDVVALFLGLTGCRLHMVGRTK
jgi:hypothetical protein